MEKEMNIAEDKYNALLKLLESGKMDEFNEMLDEHPDIEVAEFITQLPDETAIKVLRAANDENRADVYSNLTRDEQLRLAAKLPREELAELFTHMPTDDRVDLYSEMSEEQQKDLLPYFSKAIRDDILHLSSYPPKTAGAAMSSNFARISKYMTVAQAMQRLKIEAPTRETIYYIYVVDDEMRLIGFVSLRDLITEDETTPVSDIMITEIVKVQVYDDQEDVVKLIEKYDILAIPVVNIRDQLVGIVTHDDALDILRQEQTEDMERFMAIGGEHEHLDYVNKSPFSHFKGRIGWVTGFAALGLVSGFIIHSFEEFIESLIILALFLPMVADTGGNTGSQSATVIVRSLALGELTPNRWLFVIWKEFRVAIMIGIIIGIMAFGKVFLLSYGTELPGELTLPIVATAISLAISFQVISSILIGSSLPIVAKRLNIDPALVSSPAITTLVDITGLLIYFYTTKIILGF